MRRLCILIVDHASPKINKFPEKRSVLSAEQLNHSLNSHKSVAKQKKWIEKDNRGIFVDCVWLVDDNVWWLMYHVFGVLRLADCLSLKSIIKMHEKKKKFKQKMSSEWRNCGRTKAKEEKSLLPYDYAHGIASSTATVLRVGYNLHQINPR